MVFFILSRQKENISLHTHIQHSALHKLGFNEEKAYAKAVEGHQIPEVPSGVKMNQMNQMKIDDEKKFRKIEQFRM